MALNKRDCKARTSGVLLKKIWLLHFAMIKANALGARCACRRAPHLCTSAHQCACTAGKIVARVWLGSLQTRYKPSCFSVLFFFFYELCEVAVRLLHPKMSPPRLRYCLTSIELFVHACRIWLFKGIDKTYHWDENKRNYLLIIIIIITMANNNTIQCI